MSDGTRMVDLEKAVEDLKRAVRFKDETHVGDVVLFLKETDDDEGQIGAYYAVVTGFIRDTAKRDEWWHVQMQFLTIPPQPQSIILQAPHFTGQEIFTMGGRKVFIKALDFSTDAPSGDGAPEDSPETEGSRGGLRVVK